MLPEEFRGLNEGDAPSLELMQACIEQTLKDFERCNLPLVLDLTTIQPEHFFFLLTEHLGEIIKNRYDAFQLLLYRIDLNEKKVGELIRTEKGHDLHRALATAVLRREMQKVLLRRAFSAGSNPDQ